jgi:hypothetical protein
LKRIRNSDFTRVSSGLYPILERFEPIGSAFQKRGALCSSKDFFWLIPLAFSAT